MNLPKIVICCEFVVNDVKNVLFVVIGRELCPGLFFSDREEKDPRSSAGGAREAEPVRIHGEPVRLSETPHGENRTGLPTGKTEKGAGENVQELPTDRIRTGSRSESRSRTRSMEPVKAGLLGDGPPGSYPKLDHGPADRPGGGRGREAGQVRL